MDKDQDLLLNLCGRGDKDMLQVPWATPQLISTFLFDIFLYMSVFVIRLPNCAG